MSFYKSGEFAQSVKHTLLSTMKITIHNEAKDEAIAIEIPEDFKLADLKAYVEAETGVSTTTMVLVHNNIALERSESELKDLGIEDDDILLLRSTNVQTNTVTDPSSSIDDRLELYRQELLNNPQLNSDFQNRYPQLMETVHDPVRFKNTFNGLMYSQFEQSPEHLREQEEWRRIQQNPDDPENQAKILEMINQEKIKENLQLAYEISPESFVPVHLLQIKLKINGHEAHALVDSGAQTTIIHPKLAEEFGILNLIDKSWSGEVRGVGSLTSKGRIHSVRVSLGESEIELPCSFLVLETSFGVIFGLDMLKRHKCSINLGKDVLEVGGMEFNFLSEAEERKVQSFGPEVVDKSSAKVEIGKEPRATHVPTTVQLAPNVSETHDNFPDESLNQLLSLGFTRDEAIAALRSTNGNVELAASLLFN